MTAISPQNPLGLLAIDHLEFTVDSLQSPTKELFYGLGFAPTYRAENSELFSQGQIRFLINGGPEGHHRDYFNQHGEGVCTISFLVEDAAQAIDQAVQRGAQAMGDLKTVETEHGVFRTARIKGFGDVANEFIERPSTPFRPPYGRCVFPWPSPPHLAPFAH